ncbi:hypothetical protein [Arenimonas sp.]|uniref:hypothetical protein n=1 Tax=Arenimonas sp. TaxID=1872635 RepID=UPI0035AF3768
MPVATAVLALAIAASGSSGAASPRPLDRWSLSLGGFDTTTDTTLRARARAGEYGADGRINLERDLGLGRRQPVTKARLDLLVGDRQGFGLEYFGFQRGNAVTLARDLEYDGRLYAARAELRSHFDYDFSSAAWRWWAGEGDTAWGLGLGVAHYRVRTVFEGEASIDDVSVDGRVASDDRAFAPLLSLGWRHAVDDRLRLYAEIAGVAHDGGRLGGHIVDASLGLEWFPFDRLGVAVEYGGTQIRLDRRRSGPDASLAARLDLKLRGPSLLLRLR